MMWGIRKGWRFEAVEVVKQTEKMVFYIDAYYGNRETRTGKDHFFDWRGDEDAARALVAKLTSAKAEYDRRAAAASDWYQSRKAEIFAGEES